jgi:hypothetical protein
LVFVVRSVIIIIWFEESDIFGAPSLGDTIRIDDIRAIAEAWVSSRLSIAISSSAPKTTVMAVLTRPDVYLVHRAGVS